MRSSNTANLSDSNDFLCSYLVELRNIAINSRSLSYSTSLRLKKAAILIGSRRVRKQKSEKVADLLDVDEEDWDVEYDLLAPSNVAIADDTIALQQFGEVIFCAPQEDILEGEHVSAFSGAASQTRKSQVFINLLVASVSATLFERTTESPASSMRTRQHKRSGP